MLCPVPSSDVTTRRDEIIGTIKRTICDRIDFIRTAEAATDNITNPSVCRWLTVQVYFVGDIVTSY